MKRKIVREVLSAYSAWITEIHEAGMGCDDFDFEETVDAVMEEVDHKKFP
jgi:hypothetical protein